MGKWSVVGCQWWENARIGGWWIATRRVEREGRVCGVVRGEVLGGDGGNKTG